MQAATACRLQPDTGDYQSCLGVAQYRIGEYEAAIKTLAHSAELNARQLGGPHPADLAFQAMACHRLGCTADALKTLEQSRQLLEQDRWKDDAESQRFLNEAEALFKPISPSIQ